VAEADAENTMVIAAVNRCATQKQEQIKIKIKTQDKNRNRNRNQNQMQEPWRTLPWNPTPSASLRAGSCAKNAQGWSTHRPKWRNRRISFSANFEFAACSAPATNFFPVLPLRSCIY
jgi:hypothetical protein